MQDTIMQKLKEEIVKTENTLRKIASENIISRQENTIEHARTMQNIELITRISRLIEDADFKQHKNDLVQKGINLMPLNSNFKSKHPVAVYIDDQPHSAKYLRDIARIVCAHLLRVKRQEMLAEASNFKTLARGDCYASFEKSDVAAGKLLRSCICLLGKTDSFQELVSLLRCLFLGHHLQSGRGKHDVVLDRHVREEIELLEHHTDFFPHLVDVDGFVSNINAFEENLTAGRDLKQV